jgi:hypothetical protein
MEMATGMIVSAQFEARSHECERCTQECVRHDLIPTMRAASEAKTKVRG